MTLTENSWSSWTSDGKHESSQEILFVLLCCSGRNLYYAGRFLDRINITEAFLSLLSSYHFEFLTSDHSTFFWKACLFKMNISNWMLKSLYHMCNFKTFHQHSCLNKSWIKTIANVERRKFPSSPLLPTLDKEVRSAESNRETVLPRKTIATGCPLPVVVLRLYMDKEHYRGWAGCFYHLWIHVDSGGMTPTNEERCREFVESREIKGENDAID